MNHAARRTPLEIAGAGAAAGALTPVGVAGLAAFAADAAPAVTELLSNAWPALVDEGMTLAASVQIGFSATATWLLANPVEAHELYAWLASIGLTIVDSGPAEFFRQLEHPTPDGISGLLGQMLGPLVGVYGPRPDEPMEGPAGRPMGAPGGGGEPTEGETVPEPASAGERAPARAGTVAMSPEATRVKSTLMGRFRALVGRITGVGARRDAVAGAPGAELTATGQETGPTRVILQGDDDVIPRYAANVEPLPDTLDVFVHGDVDDFIAQRDGTQVRIDHRRLANYIRKSGARYQRVRLISCKTGLHVKGVAQHLANKLGVEVIAPTDNVHIAEDGSMTIGRQPGQNNGKWITFEPAQSERRFTVPDEPAPERAIDRLHRTRADQQGEPGAASPTSSTSMAGEEDAEDTSISEATSEPRLEAKPLPSTPAEAQALRDAGLEYDGNEIRAHYLRMTEGIDASNEEWIKQGKSAEERARLAYEIRHKARVTARAMDHRTGIVNALRERDLKKYGSPDGPTFEYLVEKAKASGIRRGCRLRGDHRQLNSHRCGYQRSIRAEGKRFALGQSDTGSLRRDGRDGEGTMNFNEALATTLTWRKTDDVDHPWEAIVDGHVWRLRLGDYPAEDLFALIVDGQEIGSLNTVPKAWHLAGASPRTLKLVGNFREMGWDEPGAPSLVALRGKRSAGHKAEVLTYLRKAEAISLSPGFERDFFDDAQYIGLPTMRTDGVYVGPTSSRVTSNATTSHYPRSSSSTWHNTVGSSPRSSTATIQGAVVVRVVAVCIDRVPTSVDDRAFGARTSSWSQGWSRRAARRSGGEAS